MHVNDFDFTLPEKNNVFGTLEGITMNMVHFFPRK